MSTRGSAARAKNGFLYINERWQRNVKQLQVHLHPETKIPEVECPRCGELIHPVMSPIFLESADCPECDQIIPTESLKNDLVEIIGDYITAFEGLKTQYENFAGKAITVDENAAKLMRFNNYVELVVGASKVRASLTALSVNSLTLRLFAAPPGLADGETCSAKLYFQVYQFTANGKVSGIQRGQDGQMLVMIAIDFTPELIEILDDFFFRQRIQAKPK